MTDTYRLESIGDPVKDAVLEKLNATVGLDVDTLLWEASKESSPLHNDFIWDDGIAGDLYRRSQAGAIIRRAKVRVVNEGTGEAFTFRKWFPISQGETDEERMTVKHQRIDVILNDPTLRAELLETAKRELESFRRKYAKLNELSGIIREIDAIIPPVEQMTVKMRALPLKKAA